MIERKKESQARNRATKRALVSVVSPTLFLTAQRAITKPAIIRDTMLNIVKRELCGLGYAKTPEVAQHIIDTWI